MNVVKNSYIPHRIGIVKIDIIMFKVFIREAYGISLVSVQISQGTVPFTKFIVLKIGFGSCVV
jgi:hypothetical protein